MHQIFRIHSVTSFMNSTHTSDLAGWNAGPEGRGTLSTIWSCSLVLVCVWTVLYDNIKARDDNEWEVFIRRLCWSILAVSGPEMLTLFAMMQWNGAKRSVREMEGFRESHHVEWTTVHAFYANAGGFLLATADFPAFPINATSVHYLCSHDRIEPPQISKDDIWDRSKADRFAKTVGVFQVGWLLCNIVERLASGLTVTPLEIFTAAFIIPTLATLYLWWEKQLHITFPTTITVDWHISEVLLSASEAAKCPYVDTPMDFVEKPLWEGWRRRTPLLHFGGLKRRPLIRIPNDYTPPPPTGNKHWLYGLYG